jgi:hypothetical protein
VAQALFDLEATNNGVCRSRRYNQHSTAAPVRACLAAPVSTVGRLRSDQRRACGRDSAPPLERVHRVARSRTLTWRGRTLRAEGRPA